MVSTSQDGRPSFSASVRQLSTAQKSGRGAPAYSRYVNRRLGRLLAAAAHVAGMTPNVVTAVSGVCSFAGIVVLAVVWPTPWLGVLVAGLLVLGYALDAADGQLARLRGGGSVSGEWLDHMVDSAKISSLHCAVAIGWFRAGELDRAWLLVPLAFAVVAAVSFFAQILNEQLLRGHGVRPGPAGTDDRGGASTLASFLKVPTDYGVLCLVFLTWGLVPAFAWLYTALLVASAGYLALAMVKWYRQMTALDRGGTT